MTEEQQGYEVAPFDGLALFDNSDSDGELNVMLLENGETVTAQSWLPDTICLVRLRIEPASAEDWQVWEAARKHTREVRAVMNRIYMETRPKPCPHCGCKNPPADHDCIAWVEQQRRREEVNQRITLRSRAFYDGIHASNMAELDAKLEELRKLRAWKAGE